MEIKAEDTFIENFSRGDNYGTSVAPARSIVSTYLEDGILWGVKLLHQCRALGGIRVVREDSVDDAEENKTKTGMRCERTQPQTTRAQDTYLAASACLMSLRTWPYMAVMICALWSLVLWRMSGGRLSLGVADVGEYRGIHTHSRASWTPRTCHRYFSSGPQSALRDAHARV